jgi:CPA1 family monovalent cation:H+ antiporter
MAMILSNIINRFFPRLPLPLIQLIFGFFLGYFGSEHVLRLNPEIFLAVVIAPLLFREGEESDIPSILKHWQTVLFLAFIVVFITVFSVGYCIHWMIPALPLAACFAIGAALGPTDIVAMTSLSKEFSFPKRVSNVLKGEGLINDASGIISFQFAINALTLGTFSLSKASVSLLFSVFGGVLVGIVLGILNRKITGVLEELITVDVTGHLLMEIVLPFLSFFIAEKFHVSGIIASVVAGVLQASRFKKITLLDARVDAVTNTVWKVLTFAMTSLVFILFGVELEVVFFNYNAKNTVEGVYLIFIILLATAVLFITRFVILALYYRFVSWRRQKSYARYLHDALLLTFSGVKGTVSIATILLAPSLIHKSIPSERPTMILLVAGVTLCTFVTGMIVLPILGEQKEVLRDHYVEIDILEEVIAQLEEDAKKLRNRAAIDATIDNYRMRIQNLVIDSEFNKLKKDLYKLRLKMLKMETQGLKDAYQKKEINDFAYEYYFKYIKLSEQRISHSFISPLNFLAVMLKRMIFNIKFRFKFIRSFILRKYKRQKLTSDEKRSIRTVYVTNTKMLLSFLEKVEGKYNSKLIDYLKADRVREMEILRNHSFVERIIIKARLNNVEEMMRGYYLERKIIFEYKEKEKLTGKKVLELQKNVNVLESYSLKEKDPNLSYSLFDFLRYHGE